MRHLLILALLKTPLHAAVLEAYASMQLFEGVPLDEAFKLFVCSLLHPENQPKDKQLPESQAWSHFQTVFGTEYSLQNKGTSYSMSPYAADALAGSLLFLHSTSHNPNAAFIFEKEDWISKTKESMGIPFSSEVLGGMYAVSYTHLRAHETPEHLVCRLLLEKKNKQKKKNKSGHTTYHG
eukprot:TRINITY_DN20024_c0_g1_i2.p1 TRINITY_DN20024_c0_g1~~TRINITY_DN20024_c0_g1_i2.p1  ORF type:complete len:180 (+),score=35.65 TRINITY_DN20024_c0_g1_i2:2-541(+)